METGFTKMNADEYRKFGDWIAKHGQEMYENKIAYEVRYSKDRNFWVKLADENIYTLDDIILDMEDKL